MEAQTRRAIAYIAARLASKAKPESIYDHDASQHYKFTGDVSPHEISVFDYAQKNIITGSSQGFGFALLFSASRTHVRLQVVGSKFSGQNLDTGARFSGKVDGLSVTYFDEADSKFYNFSI